MGNLPFLSYVAGECEQWVKTMSQVKNLYSLSFTTPAPRVVEPPRAQSRVGQAVDKFIPDKAKAQTSKGSEDEIECSRLVLSSAKTIAEKKQKDIKEKIKQKAEDYMAGEQEIGKLYVQVNGARFNEQGMDNWSTFLIL